MILCAISTSRPSRFNIAELRALDGESGRLCVVADSKVAGGIPSCRRLLDGGNLIDRSRLSASSQILLVLFPVFLHRLLFAGRRFYLFLISIQIILIQIFIILFTVQLHEINQLVNYAHILITMPFL